MFFLTSYFKILIVWQFANVIICSRVMLCCIPSSSVISFFRNQNIAPCVQPFHHFEHLLQVSGQRTTNFEVINLAAVISFFVIIVSRDLQSSLIAFSPYYFINIFSLEISLFFISFHATYHIKAQFSLSSSFLNSIKFLFWWDQYQYLLYKHHLSSFILS